ncbi:hypothetical protein [Pectinatus haikarae]|uniref:Uncharacterized protein n=1 Tax=Pectinatus haikarae TaxID=349096 RepID=A0ABT9Y4M6_9FIRM|nr:hypothetical protein [Pectinatus haikarae]MDQ0202676.1 hypothetical protein [Pectinatus haikarae]
MLHFKIKNKILIFIIVIIVICGCFYKVFNNFAALKEGKLVDIQNKPEGVSRNSFSQEAMCNPYNLTWTGITLINNTFKVLHNPKTSISDIFDGNIMKLPNDEYYAGAYTLRDNLQCPLFWISNNDELSLGFQLEGSDKNIQSIFSTLFENLGETTQKEETDSQKKYYWLNKIYRGKKYFIECDISTNNDNSLLLVVFHPQIYH